MVHADVQSANVVGYQNVYVASGYNLFAPTFKNISQAKFKLSEIVPLHQDGQPFGTGGSRRCNGVIKINKVNAEGNYTTTYSYIDTVGGKCGWYDGDTKVEGENEVYLEKGEGVLVNNQYKSQPVLFRVSGEVDLECINTIPSGYNVFGNSTPVTNYLSQIVMLHQDGEPFGTGGSRRCNGVIKINKVNAEGNYTTTYSYIDTVGGKCGWYDGDTKVEGENDVAFAPGESFLINNQYKSQPVLLKIPAPIK